MDDELKSRFPALSFIASIMKVAGWIFSVLAAFGTFMVLADAFKEGHRFNAADMLQVALSFGGIISGLGVVAFGEVIGVCLSIEHNTRQSAENLSVVIAHSAETSRQLAKALTT